MSRNLVYAAFVAFYLAIGLVVWMSRQSIVITSLVATLGFLTISFLNEIPAPLFRISELYSLCLGILLGVYGTLQFGWDSRLTLGGLGLFLGLVYSPHFRERSRASLFDRSIGTAAGGVTVTRFALGANWSIPFTLMLISVVATGLAAAEGIIRMIVSRREGRSKPGIP